MKITDALQKRLLWDLFIEMKKHPMTGMDMPTAREFDIKDLNDASSAKKALFNEIDQQTGMFKEGEITFSIAEAALLKTLFDQKKKWNPDHLEAYEALKALFNQK